MKIKFQSFIVGRVAPSVFGGAYRQQLLMKNILKLVGLDTCMICHELLSSSKITCGASVRRTAPRATYSINGLLTL
jgi:hypothetical protein